MWCTTFEGKKSYFAKVEKYAALQLHLTSCWFFFFSIYFVRESDIGVSVCVGFFLTIESDQHPNFEPYYIEPKSMPHVMNALLSFYQLGIEFAKFACSQIFWPHTPRACPSKSERCCWHADRTMGIEFKYWHLVVCSFLQRKCSVPIRKWL